MTNEQWVEEKMNEFVEKGAALEHDRWARWQKYFFDQCLPQNNDGKYVDLTLCIPKYERWNRQIATPYAELSELEKESDRKESRTYLPMLKEIILSALNQGEQRFAERLREGIESKKKKGEQFFPICNKGNECWDECSLKARLYSIYNQGIEECSTLITSELEKK
jgi:hypothetical protein